MNSFFSFASTLKPVVQLEPGETLIWQRDPKGNGAVRANVVVAIYSVMVVVLGPIAILIWQNVDPAQSSHHLVTTGIDWLAIAAFIAAFVNCVRFAASACRQTSVTNKRIVEHDYKHDVARQWRLAYLGAPTISSFPGVQSLKIIRLENLDTCAGRPPLIAWFRWIACGLGLLQGDARLVGVPEPSWLADEIGNAQAKWRAER
ncbi:MAG: hypothetical protein AAGE80_10625 [Pseudomonadota bacterium]